MSICQIRLEFVLALGLWRCSHQILGSQTGQFEPPLPFSPSAHLYSHESSISIGAGNGVAESGNAHQPVNTYGLESIPVDHSAANLDFMTEEMLFFSSTADFNNQNLDFGFLDFNFDEVHLDIANYAKDAGSNIHDRTNSTQPQRKVSRSLPRDASRAHAAFTRSPWLWTPAQKDRILIDQDK